MRKKSKRKSGHYVPKYVERLPFNLRCELDLLEQRVLFDDWIDYRDGFREPFWCQKYGNKPLLKKHEKRLIPKYLYDEELSEIVKSIKKWEKRDYRRKKSKMKNLY